MKFTKSTLTIITTSLLSANIYAASIDFRHEYKGKSEQHASRIKMSNTFENNLSVDLELKFKGADGEFMNDLQQNGSELALSYKYAINNEWALQPGMPIEFGTNVTTYKPQFRVTYTPEAIEGLSVSGRYRLDIKSDHGEASADIDNKFRDRYTFNLGYSIDKLSLGLEMNYYQSHDSSYILYDGKDTNYENNVTASYKMGNWTPWVEFGDVNRDSNSDVRELRSRVGIRYSF